MKFCRLLQI